MKTIYTHKGGAATATQNQFLKLSLMSLTTFGLIFLLLISPVLAVSTRVVSPSNTFGWAVEVIEGGQIKYVQDNTTPHGNGSLFFTTGDFNESVAKISDTNFEIIPLSELSELSYWTKLIPNEMHGGSWGEWTETWRGVPAFELKLILDEHNGYTTTLTFYPPRFDWQGEELLQDNIWQQWDAYAGDSWFSSNNVPELITGEGGLDMGIMGNRLGGGPNYTLVDVLQKYPNASVEQVGLRLGRLYQNAISYADGIIINGNIFDFEVDLAMPTTKDDCKKGGWQHYHFKNQGQCINFIKEND